MQFIRIITQKANNAFYNMALDEAISGAVRQKLSPPTLRLYAWEKPSVSIGYFQKISDVDIDYCSENKYPVVRRLTGGKAILHYEELTYSFSSHSDNPLFNGSLLNNYSVISNALVSGLNLKGVEANISFRKKRAPGSRNPACFKSVSFGEITLAGKKIIGSAQKRYKDGFIQHGSIVLRSNTEELRKVLSNSDGEDFSEIGSLQHYASEVTFDSLASSLKKAFERELQVKLITDGPSKSELKMAKELETNKYSNPEWNFSR